jgi:hypothetical protein
MTSVLRIVLLCVAALLVLGIVSRLRGAVRGLDRSVVYLVHDHDAQMSAPAADTMVRLGVERVVDGGGFGLLALAGAELDGDA